MNSGKCPNNPPCEPQSVCAYDPNDQGGKQHEIFIWNIGTYGREICLRPRDLRLDFVATQAVSLSAILLFSIQSCRVLAGVR